MLSSETIPPRCNRLSPLAKCLVHRESELVVTRASGDGGGDGADGSAELSNPLELCLEAYATRRHSTAQHSMRASHHITSHHTGQGASKPEKVFKGQEPKWHNRSGTRKVAQGSTAQGSTAHCHMVTGLRHHTPRSSTLNARAPQVDVNLINVCMYAAEQKKERSSRSQSRSQSQSGKKVCTRLQQV